MKKRRTIDKQPEQPVAGAAGKSWKINIYYVFIILFIISFVYFFFFQNYIFFFQENISLFIFSDDYL